MIKEIIERIKYEMLQIVSDGEFGEIPEDEFEKIVAMQKEGEGSEEE